MEKQLSTEIFKKINQVVDEICDKQKKILLNCGRQIVPQLTEEDVLQPNDFLDLENHPHFRFEEGFLIGVQTVQMALMALQKEIDDRM